MPFDLISYVLARRKDKTILTLTDEELISQMESIEDVELLAHIVENILTATRAAKILLHFSVDRIVEILDQILSPAKVRKIFSSNNLSSTKARDIIDTWIANTSLTNYDNIAAAIDGDQVDADDIASIFENKIDSVGMSRLIRIVNSSSLSASKAASIFESNNLSESNAERIWHDRSLSNMRRSEIGQNLSPAGISKVLYFGEEAFWKTRTSPYIWPSGIGGDSNVIWHCSCYARKVYELSPSDFSVVRSAPSPYIWPFGIGGDSNVIWHCDIYEKVYELSPSDFSVVRSANSPSSRPTGIGGDSNVIWHCDIIADKVYELSPSDFSVVRSAPSPHDDPTGIGGDSNVIWHCSCHARKVYELSPSDFSVVRSAPSLGSYPSGIGGDSNVIWHCDLNANKVYQLGI